MLKRIIRILITFAAVFAAYQAYALVAVPWIDPPINLKRLSQARPADLDSDPNPATKYQLLLSNYFPKDHWSQTQPPKVIATPSGDGMFVMDDFHREVLRQGAGDAEISAARVAIKRFAVLLFPTPPREGITPPQDAIVIEAAQGAVLEFDDFRPEAGHIGQITRGQFPGRIIIRSKMREAGPDDDLLVETADLTMNTKLLFTSSPVRFRLGPNVGVGRELEIKFLLDEHVQPQNQGLKLPGLEWMEIRRDVRVRLQLDTASLLPGKPEPGSHEEHENKSAKAKPPVEITCNGPFVFDFISYRASVDRDVVLRQMNANGPSDQLTCNQLDIHFTAKRFPDDQPEPVITDPRRRQQRDLGRLEPAAIVAHGHPVVVTSPSHGAEARGDRIQIALRDQRVMISGGREVKLVYGPNELRAPAIDYMHPATDAGSKIGRFRATGPGSLLYVPDIKKTTQILQANWQRSVELGREKGQPVLVFDGRPQLAFAGAGALSADRIRVQLRELDSEVKTAAAGVNASQAGEADSVELAPDQLAALGRVEIQSPQLTARTDEFVATFRNLGNQSTDQSIQAPKPTAPDATAMTSGGPLGFGRSASAGANASAQSFYIQADRMQMDVHLRGESATPASVVCDGNVVFREVPNVRTQEQPLEIRGGQLTISDLDSGTAHIKLIGAPPDQAGGSELAELRGRGVTVLADVVELDQRENRLWSQGPGRATILLTRDLVGADAAAPIPVEVVWQGGLAFDGRRVTFQKNVLVAGADDSLRCDELAVKLNKPIEFGQAIDQQAIDFTEIDCKGHISLDHWSRDEAGITSHERLLLSRLVINQQTGAFFGEGPGELRSTRFGDGLKALAVPAGSQTPIAASPNANGSKLNFLRLDFQRKLEGNIHTRELTFHERVRAVYGPVDSWEQELAIGSPEALPPDSILLACDELRLNEDPIAVRSSAAGSEREKRPLGYVQLQATGNVQIDGSTESHGLFSATADRSSYEQVKDVFMLEGSSRSPARLWLRRYAGEQATPLSAERIRYDRKTGLPKIERFHLLELTPEVLENTRRDSRLSR
jgi:hypothetical protein